MLNTGTYYFQFISSTNDKNSYKFTAALKKSEFIETIDLNKKNYFNMKQLNSKVEIPPKYYKVENLKEDKNVLFNYRAKDYHHEDIELNLFMICNDDNEECVDNVLIYKFLKDKRYKIYIHYIYNENHYDYINEFDRNYYFPKYMIEKKGYYYKFRKSRRIIWIQSNKL